MIPESIRSIVQFVFGVITFLGISNIPQVKSIIVNYPVITAIVGVIGFLFAPKYLVR